MKGFDTMATTGVLPVFKNQFKVGHQRARRFSYYGGGKGNGNLSVSMDGNVGGMDP